MILTVGYVARLVPLNATCTAVQAVDHPGTPVLMRSVTVQRFDHAVSEVILHKETAHALLNVITLTAILTNAKKKLNIADREQYINDCCIGGDVVLDVLLPELRGIYDDLMTNQEDWGARGSETATFPSVSMCFVMILRLAAIAYI